MLESLLELLEASVYKSHSPEGIVTVVAKKSKVDLEKSLVETLSLCSKAFLNSKFEFLYFSNSSGVVEITALFTG